MKPKVIVLDLDGTLLNSNKEISHRNCKALTNIAKEGIDLIFATARPPRVVKFDGLDIKNLGSMIYYNGAYIECEKTELNQHFGISSKLGFEIINFIKYLDNDANISIEIKDKWYSFKELNYMKCEFMKTDHNPEIIDLEYIKSQELTKILITAFKYSKELSEEYGNAVNIINTDRNQLLQIMSKEAGKEKGVKQIVKNLGTNLNDVLCFGDDYNDLELFRSCGYTIAMENGINELKLISNEITRSNDEDGVAIVLERILTNGIL